MTYMDGKTDWIPPVGRDDTDKPTVQAALTLLNNCYSTKTDRDLVNLKIQDLFEEGSYVTDVIGTKQLGSKIIFEVLWKLMSYLKPLDFKVDGTGRPQYIEDVTTAGIATILRRGGYAQSMRDKNGAFINASLYGDGFIQVGAGKDYNYAPVVFRKVDNANIYIDPSATVMRDDNGGSGAAEVAVIFKYSWDRACQLFPQLKRIGGVGEIPRLKVEFKDGLNRKSQQKIAIDETAFVEICYYYNLNDPSYTVFAGTACTVLETNKKDDYPFFIYKNPYASSQEPYIPLVQLMCQPTTRGFYNIGVGNLLYDIATVYRQLSNMEMGHIKENAFPVEILSVPKGQADKVFSKLQEAKRQRDLGYRPFLAVEYDQASGNQIGTSSLTYQNLFQELMAVLELLKIEVQRLTGINLDVLDRGDVTATQILSEEEAQTAFPKQMGEYNASEQEFAIRAAMQITADTVPYKAKGVIDMEVSVKLPVAGEEPIETKVDEVPIGMIAEELDKHNYFVKMNVRSGSIPSNVFRGAELVQAMNAAVPGSKADFQIRAEYLKLRGVDTSMEDLGYQGATKTPQAELDQAPITGTDTEKVNRGQLAGVPAI